MMSLGQIKRLNARTHRNTARTDALLQTVKFRLGLLEQELGMGNTSGAIGNLSAIEEAIRELLESAHMMYGAEAKETDPDLYRGSRLVEAIHQPKPNRRITRVHVPGGILEMPEAKAATKRLQSNGISKNNRKRSSL